MNSIINGTVVSHVILSLLKNRLCVFKFGHYVAHADLSLSLPASSITHRVIELVLCLSRF